MWRLRYFSFIGLVILLGCSDDDAPEPIGTSDEYLVSATFQHEFSTTTFQLLATLLGVDEISSLIKHNVLTYTIVYNTTYKGEEIQASGILYLPKNLAGPAPLLSIHHGTTLNNDSAPSVSQDFTGLEFFGTAGYIAFAPDFIGYGESDDIFHPYYDEEHSAIAVTDMIKAIKEFLTDENIPFNEKLFLAGYSEGGYVTLAAAKSIEENPIPDLDVVAVAAGAGGYDLVNLLDEIVSDEEYVYPSYFAFMVMAYNETNDWDRPLTDYFNEPYATALATYMTGDHGGEFINGQLTNNLSELLAENFYEELTDDEVENDFESALSNNSINGWDTDLPIRLYHSEQDEIIPYENSVTTFQNFKDAGSENVELVTFPIGDHVQALTPTLVDVITWFEELK